jgi:GTP-binding protein Era
MSGNTHAHRTGFVSITGRPNAGKSTLLNALIGEKLAITARQPQTTRTSVQGVLTTPDAQVIFVDTPGIHKSDTLFNQRMMQTVRSELEARDLVLFVADATRPIEDEDRNAIGVLKHSEKALLVLNKIDRLPDKRLVLPVMEEYSKLHGFLEVLPVSASKKDGLDELRRTIVKYLPEGPPLFPDDYLTDQPMRFLAAEIIREKILRVAHQEVPHAVAVVIDRWEEKPRLTRIAATILVERPGQKSILIGTKGEVMKKIGTEARQELEKLADTKIFLELFVKVKKNWRDDPAFLNSMDWRAMVGSE